MYIWNVQDYYGYVPPLYYFYIIITIMLRYVLSRRGAFAVAPLGAYLSSVSSSMSTASTTEEMNPDTWVPLTLTSTTELTSGERPTYLFSFSLAPSQPSIPVSSCLVVRAPVGDVKEDGTRAMVVRPYTPVSHPDSKQLDLAIKIYEDGKIGQYLAKHLKVGDVLEFKGPIVKYHADDARKKTRGIGMIAGGTGITPMLQMAEELLRTGYTSPLTLVYCNQTPGDIMLKSRLDALQQAHANFSVHYMVDAVPKGTSWNGGTGYVTRDVISKWMPSPEHKDDALVLVCGPPPMMKAVSGNKVSPKDQGPLQGILKDMGYRESQVFKF